MRKLTATRAERDALKDQVHDLDVELARARRQRDELRAELDKTFVTPQQRIARDGLPAASCFARSWRIENDIPWAQQAEDDVVEGE